jgi:hypothetical protein
MIKFNLSKTEFPRDNYTPPPSYTSGSECIDESDSKPLITRLKIRIEKDLHQINGLYDDMIKSEENVTASKISEINDVHFLKIDSINRQRLSDINDYNVNAESRIDDVISTLDIETTGADITGSLIGWTNWLIGYDKKNE